MSGAVSEIGHCGRCRMASPGNFTDWHFGQMKRSVDIHCGAFDRRVTPVGGCSKFLRVGGQFHPLPLEH